jgi:tetratricopeptide (TPR) repeat protein
VDAHLNLGLVYFRRGLYRDAAEGFQRAIELDPESPAAYVYLGESFNYLARWEEALDALRTAVELKPSTRAYYVMGIVYDRLQQPDRAAEMYRRSRENSS